jgi:hypothetical protein
MVAITIDPRELAKLERAIGHIKGAVPKAISAAINRTLDRGRTTLRREIRKQYLIKQKDIPVKVRRASVSHLGGEVRTDSGMLELAKFKITPKGVQKRAHKKPIRAQVKKTSGGKLIKHGFVAQMPSGFVGPFLRKGGTRLPLKKLLTIGAPIMATQPGVGPAVNKAMGEAFARNVDSQIDRFLKAA